MALQVPEGAVVGDHVEPVVGAFERPAGTMATVGPLPHVGPQQRPFLLGTELADPGEHLVLGPVGERCADGGDHLVLAVGVEVDQGDRGTAGGAADRVLGGRHQVGEELFDQPPGLAPGWRAGTRTRHRRGPAGRPAGGRRGSPCAALRASGRRTAGPRAADGCASAAGASRRTARCRRCRRWRASRPAGARGGRRAPWPAPPDGGRSRSRRAGAGAGPRARPGPRRATRRRCRTCGPCPPRSGRRAASRADRDRGSSGSGRW